MYIEQNYEMDQGNTGDIVFTVTGVSALIDVDIKYHISRTKSGEAVIEKTVGNGITVDNNQIRVLIQPNETVDLPAGRYYHTLKVKDTSGKIDTGAKGQLRLHPCTIRSDV